MSSGNYTQALPVLKGSHLNIKWATEIRAAAIKSTKFSPMFMNLIRRVNDAEWWITNRHDLTLGRFRQPKPSQLEPITPEQMPPPKRMWFSWFTRLMQFRKMKAHTHIYERVTTNVEGDPAKVLEEARKALQEAEQTMKSAMKQAETLLNASNASVETTTVRLHGKRFRTCWMCFCAAISALLCNEAEIQIKVKK